jgi:two-component system, OmpR family, sensor kinase
MRLGLRARLVATTVLAALGSVTVLVIGLQLLLAHQTSRESLDVLRSRTDAVAATVRFPGGRVRVLETPSRFLDQDIWVFDAGRHLVDGSRPPPGLRSLVARLAGSRASRSIDIDASYRLRARPVAVPGANRTGAVVVAALDLAPYESAERRGLWLSLGLGFLTVVAAGAAAWVASGYALHQVRRMARRADDWREHDLSGRFALGSPRDELTELADTLDRMLDRIAQAILTERRLTDEVAHELRTPLAVIRSEAQLAQMSGDPTGVPAEALNGIVAATERMSASIETMLRVARSAHEHAEPCPVADVLGELRAHAVARSDVTVRVLDDATEVLVAAPLPVVTAAAVPLLDNAVRHARREVCVHATTHHRQVLLHVEDDGGGVEPEDREAIFTPGHTSAPGGAGLGLALSRRLAHSVGGEVHERGNGHGHFVLSLPRVG